MNLLNVEQQLNQQLITVLKNQPPISIELYPLEIYFLARRCLFALLATPTNRLALQLMEKLKAALIHRYPQLKITLDRLLNTGA